MQLPDIRTVKDLRGKRVLLRASLNEPVIDERVAGDSRLVGSLETIRFLTDSGARVIVIGHRSGAASETFVSVYEYLKQYIPISFVKEVVGPLTKRAVASLADGDSVLLENIRSEKGETENNPEFAKTLASYADIFVNDDFTVAHRVHSGVVGVPEYIRSYAGPQFVKEVEGLTLALTPEDPSLAVIGGAKFETKAPLIQAFLKTYDTVFVGGALANDFFKARGYVVGRSLVSAEIPDEDLLGNDKLKLPVDLVVENGGKTFVKKPEDIVVGDYIYDAGPETSVMLERLVHESRFVLWNGPLGQYDAGYTESTERFARTLSASTVRSVVGGGDTVTAIAKLHPEDGISFVSTAGGAMLEFLLKGTLPGIEALRRSAKQFRT